MLSEITLFLLAMTGNSGVEVTTPPADHYLSSQVVAKSADVLCVTGCVVLTSAEAADVRAALRKQIQWAYEQGVRDTRKIYMEREKRAMR